MRIAALSAPSSGSNAPSAGPASGNSGLADTIGSETKIASMTKVIFINYCSDMRRLYIWCAAYHAAGAVQYNIGGGAHCFGRHCNREANNTAHHKWCGNFKQNTVGRNIFRNRRQVSLFRANSNRYAQGKANRSAEFDRTIGCDCEGGIHELIIIRSGMNGNPLKRPPSRPHSTKVTHLSTSSFTFLAVVFRQTRLRIRNKELP